MDGLRRPSQGRFGTVHLLDEEIELGACVLIEPPLLDVTGDADDSEPWLRPAWTQPLADRVPTRPELPGQRLVDDRHHARRVGVGGLEAATLDDWDAHGLEEVRHHALEMLDVGRRVTVGRT